MKLHDDAGSRQVADNDDMFRRLAPPVPAPLPVGVSPLSREGALAGEAAAWPDGLLDGGSQSSAAGGRQVGNRAHRAPVAVAHPDARLLIVQSNAFIARSLRRCLEHVVPVVGVAETTAEAEMMLADPERLPTHVICGQYFGEGAELGTDVIPRWRRRYSNLRQVILATAIADLPSELEGVDAVAPKPLALKVLAAQLEL